LARLGEEMQALVQVFHADEHLAEALRTERFTPLEQRVVPYVFPFADPVLRGVVAGHPGLQKRLANEPPLKAPDAADLVESLKIPARAALRTVKSVLTKLLGPIEASVLQFSAEKSLSLIRQLRELGTRFYRAAAGGEESDQVVATAVGGT